MEIQVASHNALPRSPVHCDSFRVCSRFLATLPTRPALEVEMVRMHHTDLHILAHGGAVTHHFTTEEKRFSEHLHRAMLRRPFID